MRSSLLLLAAAVLTVTGEIEVLLGSGSTRERVVGALAIPVLTAAVASSRRTPLGALAVVACTLAAQAALGGGLVGASVTTLAVLAITLYLAGRELSGAVAVGAGCTAAAVIAATRIAYDPAARPLAEALLTCAAVATPLLVGRWARSQQLLQRALADTAVRRNRTRAQAARHAAEEERTRIAADLQLAVTDALRGIGDVAAGLERDLRAGREAGAGERLADIATAARAALADIRRVLGVLRRKDEAPSLEPPQRRPPAPPEIASLPSGEAVPVEAGHRPDFNRWLVAIGTLAAAAELAVIARPAAALTAVPVIVPLLWRRRWPLPVAAAVLGGIALQSALIDLDRFPFGDMLAMVLATYAIGAHCERRRALVGVALIATASGAHAAAFYPDGIFAAVLGGVALPWTVGRIVRANRQLTREGRRRNAEIERSRAREAAAAVTQERLRLARELHDAVAHNVSVIAIQAGGAEGLIGRDHERAANCVQLIRAVAAEALAELARLTDLPAVQDAPPPSLAQLDQLAARARATGLELDLSVDARPPGLPASVDLAAFRIVQEALANIAKHAGATRASVSVRYQPHAIELDIADDGRGLANGSARDSGSGHGLVGMRERVALFGGAFDAGPGSGRGFRVHARLPVQTP